MMKCVREYMISLTDSIKANTGFPFSPVSVIAKAKNAANTIADGNFESRHLISSLLLNINEKAPLDSLPAKLLVFVFQMNSV